MVKRSPGSGERTARFGLRYQDRASAVLAYQALVDGTLSFIALADDQAGMFDDLVIGIAGKVIGHQYKSSSKPKPFGVRRLLLGTGNVIADCAASFMKLEAEFPGKFVRVRYVTSHIASVGDKGQFGVKEQDSADFFREKERPRGKPHNRGRYAQPQIDRDPGILPLHRIRGAGLQRTDTAHSRHTWQAP